MNEQVQIKTNSGGIMSFLGKVPWALLVVIYPVLMYEFEIDMNGSIEYGFVYVAIGVFVLFVEFFKSGDINVLAFLLDLVWAVTAVVLTTALMTWSLLELNPQGQAAGNAWQTLNYFHWFGCAIILGDAVISPFNSFRTALRNLGLGSP